MKTLNGVKTSITFEPTEIGIVSRQGGFILLSTKTGAQHNLSCSSEQEAIDMFTKINELVNPAPTVAN